MTITLYLDNHSPISCASKDEALAKARELASEAFEVFDEETETSLYTQYPKTRWV